MAQWKAGVNLTAAIALDAPISSGLGCPMGFGGEIDLTNTVVFAENRAHDAWRQLRRHDPVSWNPGRGRIPGFWSITKYQDVRQIARDTETFVSGRGYLMITNPKRPGRAAGVGKVLLGMDTPQHARIRRLVNSYFTPRVVARLEPQVTANTICLIDDITSLDTCDFVTEIAEPLSLTLVGTLLGVPREDWQQLSTLGDRILGTSWQKRPSQASLVGRGAHCISTQVALQRMLRYFTKLVTSRRHHPCEDVISHLISAERNGERLSDEELVHFCYLLFLAGNETTRNSISGGMLALLEHPAEWQRLRNDPAMLPTAVEEMLRWSSPIMHMARVATRDVEFGDKRIGKGEKVVLWYPSANRDQDVFASPDRFDVARHPNPHLAFGLGQHFCLGAGLARLQMRVLFASLTDRLPAIALDGHVERLHSVFIGGITKLPVRLDDCPSRKETG